MAGGGGTRLWPQSRESAPKQFSKIIGEKTLFEETLERFNDFDIDDIYVALGNNHYEKAKKLAPQISDKRFIIEPCKRDTGPAMAFVCLHLLEKFPDETIAFIPSDHFIGDNEKFLQSLKIADELIQKTGKLLDIAVEPNFPSSVLGYTQIGEKYSDEDGVEVFNFAGHTEKPDFETAKKYLEQGDYLWHASYYMWTPKKFIEAFEKYAPDILENVKEIYKAKQDNDEQKIEQTCSVMKSISIDYAVTEQINPEDVLIVKANFPWSDIGAFDVLYDAQKSKVDKNSNLIKADWVGEDTSGCLINGRPGKIIATIGLNDLVIVDTDDALLVCKKGNAQEVKKIIEKIKTNEDLKKYL